MHIFCASLSHFYIFESIFLNTAQKYFLLSTNIYKVQFAEYFSFHWNSWMEYKLVFFLLLDFHLLNLSVKKVSSVIFLRFHWIKFWNNLYFFWHIVFFSFLWEKFQFNGRILQFYKNVSTKINYTQNNIISIIFIFLRLFIRSQTFNNKSINKNHVSGIL